MILWHLGLATAIVYVTLGRRRIDYRYILAGALLPDLVDGALHLAGIYEGPSGRAVAHTLLVVISVAVLVILGVRNKERRLAIFGIPVGWLLHLVGDGMWEIPKTFLWPAFGTAFAEMPAEPYSWDLFTSPLSHLGTWGAELAGLAILVWFFIAFRLGEGSRLEVFLKDGYLRP